MLRCNACIRRTVRAVFADALEWPLYPTIAAGTTKRTARYSKDAAPCLRQQQQPQQRATYATLAVREPPPPLSYDPYPPPPSSHPPPSSSRDKNKVIKRKPPGEREDPEPSLFKQADLEKELRWLRDPLKLADHVVGLLKGDQYFKALALVRLASGGLMCTVAWNHLVDYDMAKGRVAGAVRCYNEMKKRAQVPDARTYTTLFRGLGWHAKYPNSLDRALSIYHSMFADNAPVKPSIIHTNAVLKVCAMAGDMDALLGVAAKLPDRGNGAPDTLTYTIILNAIRNSAHEDSKGQLYGRETSEGKKRAILQGRRLWEEIREKWMKGDLFMDEELVCAMGRTLSMGGEQDLDDVLSLIEQTMGVPRQVPRLGDPARHGARNPQDKHLDGFLVEGGKTSPGPVYDSVTPSHLAPLEDDKSTQPPPFSPIPKLNPATLVPPSRNTLSLALEACTAMHLPRPAQDYWGLLTGDTYNIPPDLNNYHSYLRLLRLQRASKLAVELVDDLKSGAISVPVQGKRSILEPKVFKIAMSTCSRDKNNPSALAHASSLMQTMLATLEDTDGTTVVSYLDLALSSRRTKNDYRRLLEVEKQARLGWLNIKSQLDYVDPASAKARKEMERLGMEVATRMIGLYDKIGEMGRESMEKGEARRVGEEKARLSAWVQRRQRGLARSAAAAAAAASENGDGVEEKGEEEGEIDEDTPKPVRAGDRPLKAHTKSFSFTPGPRGESEPNDGRKSRYSPSLEEKEDEDDYKENPPSRIKRTSPYPYSQPTKTNTSHNPTPHLPPQAAKAAAEWASWKASHRVDKRTERRERQRAAVARKADAGLRSEQRATDEEDGDNGGWVDENDGNSNSTRYHAVRSQQPDRASSSSISSRRTPPPPPPPPPHRSSQRHIAPYDDAKSPNTKIHQRDWPTPPLRSPSSTPRHFERAPRREPRRSSADQPDPADSDTIKRRWDSKPRTDDEGGSSSTAASRVATGGGYNGRRRMEQRVAMGQQMGKSGR